MCQSWGPLSGPYRGPYRGPIRAPIGRLYGPDRAPIGPLVQAADLELQASRRKPLNERIAKFREEQKKAREYARKTYGRTLEMREPIAAEAEPEPAASSGSEIPDNQAIESDDGDFVQHRGRLHQPEGALARET